MGINRGHSSEAVYQRLKNAIRKRYIKQGSQLIEGALAEQLGVSRTPVRSSIKQLESEGLVNIIPNRGAFVITPTFKEIEETFFVRSQMEQAAARLASAKITGDQLRQLNKLVQVEESVFNKDDPDAYYEINDALHSRIADISGNDVLAAYVKDLLDKTRTYLILFDPFSKLVLSPTLEAHQAIIDALSEHDPNQAALAIEAHISSSVENISRVTSSLVPEDYVSI